MFFAISDILASSDRVSDQRVQEQGVSPDKADGSAVGIQGSTTFTPTEANGSVDVTFTVPKGFSGEVLVAFEHLFESSDAPGTPVAVHEDINDAAQTVTVTDTLPLNWDYKPGSARIGGVALPDPSITAQSGSTGQQLSWSAWR